MAVLRVQQVSLGFGTTQNPPVKWSKSRRFFSTRKVIVTAVSKWSAILLNSVTSQGTAPRFSQLCRVRLFLPGKPQFNALLWINWQITFENVPPKQKLKMCNLKVLCFYCQQNKEILTILQHLANI